jgi:hypothetical protein
MKNIHKLSYLKGEQSILKAYALFPWAERRWGGYF